MASPVYKLTVSGVPRAGSTLACRPAPGFDCSFCYNNRNCNQIACSQPHTGHLGQPPWRALDLFRVFVESRMALTTHDDQRPGAGLTHAGCAACVAAVRGGSWVADPPAVANAMATAAAAARLPPANTSRSGRNR
jgi:hypothetical protein